MMYDNSSVIHQSEAQVQKRKERFSISHFNKSRALTYSQKRSLF